MTDRAKVRGALENVLIAACCAPHSVNRLAESLGVDWHTGGTDTIADALLALSPAERGPDTMTTLLEDVWVAAHPNSAIIVSDTEAVVRDGEGREWVAPTLVEAVRKALDDEDARPETLALNLVVNGQPITHRYVKDAPLSHVIEHALHESGSMGAREWELRTSRGELLDPSLTVDDAAYLYLSPAAGAAGTAERGEPTRERLVGCCAHCGKPPEISISPVNGIFNLNVKPTCTCGNTSFNLWPYPAALASRGAPEPTESVAFVPQRDDWDCGVASLAMAAGVSYEDALAVVPESQRGELLHTIHFTQWLGALGCAVRKVYEGTTALRGIRLIAHRGHFVVARPDGLVNDPARGAGLPLANYDNPFDVWEVHRLRAASRGEREPERGEIERAWDRAVSETHAGSPWRMLFPQTQARLTAFAKHLRTALGSPEGIR